MVEVVKPGVVTHVKYKGYCHDCGCEFTYTAGDVRRENVGVWGASDVLEFVKCPTCGNSVHASEYAGAFQKTFDRGNNDPVY